MNIKHFILMFAILLACVANVSAKDKNKPTPKCVLTLLNGEKVTGYITNEKTGNAIVALYGCKAYMPVEVTISAKPGEKGTKYKADDAKELLVIHDTGEKVKFLSLYTTKAFTMPKNLKKTGHRSFWRVEYEGAKVIGFIAPTKEQYGYSSPTMGSYHSVEYSWAYGYCIKGDDVEVTYYVPRSGIKIGEKKNIRYAFERFPKMDEYIKNDAFDLKKFKDSPLDLLKTLEKKMK